jgi:thioredoxin 1
MDDSTLRVTCLCAAWCGACREYRATFDQAATDAGAGVAFDWVDIEDEADVLDDIDVENFPTLLIARAGRTLFFGAVTPQPTTLARLVQRALAGELPVPAAGAPADALAQRLQRRRGNGD